MVLESTLEPTFCNINLSITIASIDREPSQCLFRDLNGIIKNSLKMPGSRGRIGPGGIKRDKALVGGPRGQRPLEETEFSHFYSLKIGLSWTEVG